MRLPVKLLSFAILATALAAKADTLDFTINGDGNTFTFSLPSNPTPSSFSSGASFTLANILITEGILSFTSDITFFNINDAAHDGGLARCPSGRWPGRRKLVGQAECGIARL